MPKPFLPPNEITQFFWDAARQHKLVVQRCEGCDFYIHWPEVVCPRCQSDRLAHVELSGRGAIFTYTIVHHIFHPVYADEIPYSIAIVELDEQPGLLMLANILDCPNENLRIGMPVEVTFEDREGGVTVPQFRPSEAPS